MIKDNNILLWRHFVNRKAGRVKTSDISKRTKMPEAKVPTKSNFESLESYKKRKNGCIGKQSLLGMIYEKAYLVQPAT